MYHVDPFALYTKFWKQRLQSSDRSLFLGKLTRERKQSDNAAHTEVVTNRHRFLPRLLFQTPLFRGRQLCCARWLTWCGDQTFFFLKSLSHMAMTAALLFIIKIRRWTFSSCSCWLTAALPPPVEPIICQDGDSFPCLLCSWLWESKVAPCQPHLKI